MKSLIEILFLGDIVGRPGRIAVQQYLSALEIQPDFIVANVENASHGFGLTEKNYNELTEAGIDILTSGNHIWDKKDIFNYIDRAPALLRPLNFSKTVPGKGSEIFEKDGIKIGVINLLGRVFMPPYESPWEALETEVKRLKEQTPIIFVDFHAEATAEKIGLGYYAQSLGVSVLVGTHTHVQTADETILSGTTAYITDAGSCSVVDSIIGMDMAGSLKRFITGLPERYDVAQIGRTRINGVKISIDTKTGNALEIKRINELIDIKEVG
ncbi:MAG: TIGR00282 family metallophosphoesterase [bacterium]